MIRWLADSVSSDAINKGSHVCLVSFINQLFPPASFRQTLSSTLFPDSLRQRPSLANTMLVEGPSMTFLSSFVPFLFLFDASDGKSYVSPLQVVTIWRPDGGATSLHCIVSHSRYGQLTQESQVLRETFSRSIGSVESPASLMNGGSGRLN